MRIEHVGRDTAVHAKAVRRGTALVEPQCDDSENFTQRRVAFGGAVVAKALLELAQDRFLAMPANTDDERHAEFCTISIVEPVERGELVLRKLIEPGARLLTLRI